MKNITIYKAISLLFLLSLFVFFVGYLMVNVWDPDFWWHLATGRWIVEHGKLPQEDPFSFATLQKDPYTPINRVKFILTQYWLAQILFYKIYSIYGFAGISILRAVILALTVAMIFPILKLYRVNTLLILPVVSASGYLIKSFSGERPQLFSFLFASVVLYLLEDMKRTFKDGGHKTSLTAIRYVLLPSVMLLWANLHGGYIYGIVVILIYLSSGWLELFIKRFRGEGQLSLRPEVIFTVIGIIAILSTLLNPNTYYGIIDHFRYKPLTYLTYIQEFTPTYRVYRVNIGYFVMLIILTLLLLINILRNKRFNINHILLYLFNTSISLTAVRFVPFFLITGSFLIGIHLKELIPLRFLNRKKYVETLGLIIISLSIVAFGFITGLVSTKTLFLRGVEYELYPYSAADFLQSLPSKRIFNPYTWGGYLIWELYPRYKVFMDGRGLNQEIFFQYLEVMRVERMQYAGIPKWKAILNSYGIDYVLIAPYHKYSMGLDLTYALVEDKDWQLIYADDFALIFIRNMKEFEPLIRRYSLSEDIVYAITAGQALKIAYTKTTEKKKKVDAFVTAIDALIRLNKLEDATFTLQRAYELAPDNEAIRGWIDALGLEEEFR